MLQNNFNCVEPRECPICLKDVKGVVISSQDFHKYYDFCISMESDQQPVIRCLKCNNYICIECKIKYQDICQFKCSNYGQPMIQCRPDEIYFQYGLYMPFWFIPKNNSSLWFAQSIYQYQQNPIPDLKIPSNQMQIDQALNATIELFDKINIDLNKQTISGFIQLPFDKEPLFIEYPITITMYSDIYAQLYEPKFLLEQLKKCFKDDILSLFKNFQETVGYMFQYQFKLERFPQIEPQYYIKSIDTIFGLGYTDYIKKVAQRWIQPITTVKNLNKLTVWYDPIQFRVGMWDKESADNQISCYVMHTLDMDCLRKQARSNGPYSDTSDEDSFCDQLYWIKESYKNGMSYASPEEFAEFFE